MDIAKLKASIKNIDITLVREKYKVISANIIKIYNKIDLKYLAISLGCVFSVYIVILAYVFFKAGDVAIRKIERKLASEIVALQYIPDVPTTKKKNIKKDSNYNDDANHSVTKNKKIKKTIIAIKGLYEESEYGKIPIIRSKDLLTSFRAYQLPFDLEKVNKIDKPVISFVLTDYGLSKDLSELALDLLPKEVSLLLSPYSNLPDEWLKMAREKGHEVWLQLPIQNEKFANLGKYEIFHHYSINRKLKSLKQLMGSTHGYVGLASYIDDSANISSSHYSRIADEIYARGLGFLELNPDAPKIIEAKAFIKNAPYIKSDMEVLTIKGKDSSFEKLEKIAKEKDIAVATIASYPNTIKNLAIWINKVAKSDYIVAPISAIYDIPIHRNNNKNNHE